MALPTVPAECMAPEHPRTLRPPCHAATRGPDLPSLAPRAERRSPSPENDLAQGGGASGAGAAGLAVGDQEVGVAAAFAVDHAVVAEGGALAVDGLGQDTADGPVQGQGAPGADAAGGRVDAGQPQRLVGVDVADPGNRPLAEQ